MSFFVRRNFSKCIDKHNKSIVCQKCKYLKDFHSASLHTSKWINKNEHSCKYGAT